MTQQPDAKLKEFAKTWLNGPLPSELMSDLAVILENDEYTPEKRVHQIVWQAVKWGLGPSAVTSFIRASNRLTRKATTMTLERSNTAYDIYLAKTAADDAAADAYAKQVREKQYAMIASGEAPEADAFIMAVEAIG